MMFKRFEMEEKEETEKEEYKKAKSSFGETIHPFLHILLWD